MKTIGGRKKQVSYYNLLKRGFDKQIHCTNTINELLPNTHFKPLLIFTSVLPCQHPPHPSTTMLIHLPLFLFDCQLQSSLSTENTEPDVQAHWGVQAGVQKWGAQSVHRYR